MKRPPALFTVALSLLFSANLSTADDEFPYAGIPAEKAAQVATVPAGYELKVFAAEPDIINPIAFCMDDRARVWVVEGMTYPQRAKTEPGAPEWLGGKDRILVFEGTDGDGHFDKRTVFMEGLNLVSGIEVGFRGVFVGAAPNLIFIPVENWDDPKPGTVEVLLDGWGTQDTHETLNTFHWGPDGWLYGCHGVFTHSYVGKPGTPLAEADRETVFGERIRLEKELTAAEDELRALEKRRNSGLPQDDEKETAERERLRAKIAKMKVQYDKFPELPNWIGSKTDFAGEPGKTIPVRTKLNAGIWRYHPQRKEFEVFAHGTSNPWGIDWNADGDLFAEACVIPHLFHIIQGARYQRQAGQHFDPHTYDDIKTIADHRHFLGATPHAGNGKSDSAGGGHAHAGLCIPQHPSWPDDIRGNVLMNNIHGARINMDVLERKGSGYVAHHGADFINFHDKASQIVDIREGPDGTLWMIDWYDLNQCHNPRREAHDYTTGRIFRLGKKGQKLAIKQIPTPASLIESDQGQDPWVARRALRQWAEKLTPAALQIMRAGQKERAQRMVSDFIPANVGAQQVTAEDPETFLQQIRAGVVAGAVVEQFKDAWLPWLGPDGTSGLIRQAVDEGQISDEHLKQFSKWAVKASSPIVRLALASACQRLTVEQRKPIVLALLAHEEDKDDQNLPLMYWYAAEPVVAKDAAWAAEALAACKIPKVSEFIARRLSEK